MQVIVQKIPKKSSHYFLATDITCYVGLCTQVQCILVDVWNKVFNPEAYNYFNLVIYRKEVNTSTWIQDERIMCLLVDMGRPVTL